MLRFASSPAFIHLLRTTSYKVMAASLHTLEAKLAEVMETTIESNLDERALRQVRLRVNNSGLGLPSTLNIAPAAFMAGLARCCQSFHTLFHEASGRNPSFLTELLSDRFRTSPTYGDAVDAMEDINKLTNQRTIINAADLTGQLQRALTTLQLPRFYRCVKTTVTCQPP